MNNYKLLPWKLHRILLRFSDEYALIIITCSSLVMRDKFLALIYEL